MFSGMFVGLGPLDRLHFLSHCPRKNFIDVRHRHDFEMIFHGCRNFDEILLVLLRNENGRDTAAKCREQLFLQPPRSEAPSREA